MGMDVLRSCYSANMKLWQDRDELTPVRWFFCKPDAETFEPMSSFRSLKTWSRDSDREGMVGEVQEYRPYDTGSNPLGYEGVRHCGSELAMREGGKSGLNPIITTLASGNAACCRTPPRKRVCLVGPLGEVTLLIPLAMKVTIVNRGVCPLFPAIPLFAPFSGNTPYNDPVDPGFGNFCTGNKCYWMWATGTALVYDDPDRSYETAVAIGLRANGDELPPGCAASGCSGLFLYWKIVSINKHTGTRGVSYQSCGGVSSALEVEVDPLRIVVRPLGEDGVFTVCVTDVGGNLATATHFVFEEWP